MPERFCVRMNETKKKQKESDIARPAKEDHSQDSLPQWIRSCFSRQSATKCEQKCPFCAGKTPSCYADLEKGNATEYVWIVRDVVMWCIFDMFQYDKMRAVQPNAWKRAKSVFKLQATGQALLPQQSGCDAWCCSAAQVASCCLRARDFPSANPYLYVIIFMSMFVLLHWAQNMSIFKMADYYYVMCECITGLAWPIYFQIAGSEVFADWRQVQDSS